MRVSYRIGAAVPAAHLYDVSIQVADIATTDTQLRLPAWIPGSYLVRDYARHVVSIAATNADGKALVIERPEKSSWRIIDAGNSVDIRLQVYGWDLSVRGAHLDNTHAYFNGACVFPEVLDHDGPLQLMIDRPQGLPDNVTLASSLPAIKTDAAGFGLYECEDYDALIDHPVEIAEQQCVHFDVRGIPHRFFIRGAHAFDHQRLAADCTRICEEHHALLGAPDDLNAYTFMAYALADDYGGLEHRWSTSLAISRSDLPRTDGNTDETAYRKCLGLISHEYFHLWNVRRLKPAVFTPLDMSREVHTGLLWVFEGITSYYDDLAMVRSGVISLEDYLSLLGQNLTRVMRTPGRLRQTLELSSFDAWTRFYKQDENAANAIVSYYAKGALAALALDMKLRCESDTNLDAVMRAAWQRFYLDGDGMPERGLEALASELSGLGLAPFFDQLIRGTEDIDLAALLAAAGIRYRTRAAAVGIDVGGAPAPTLPTGFAGWRFEAREAGKIAAISAGSPAESAGLSAGDILVAINARRANATQAAAQVAVCQPGDALQVTVFRRDVLHAMTLTVGEPPSDTVWLEIDASADATATAHRAQWLQSLQVGAT